MGPLPLSDQQFINAGKLALLGRLGVADHLHCGIASEHRLRLVRRGIVDDDDINRHARLAENRLDRLANDTGAVMSRNDNRHSVLTSSWRTVHVASFSCW